ncbi:hypothetical protein [Chitinolyticbacter albus]|uniref:hypothetical protein n=1 Tax=Chitinolyticbacter albus TaxID=2961951 RepID=UPI0021097FC0|nr:hypothetical protein [Chitinolyticbacter albus]
MPIMFLHINQIVKLFFGAGADVAPAAACCWVAAQAAIYGNPGMAMRDGGK